jgi:pimeloyl-ACP methyl ester carboxylesterase
MNSIRTAKLLAFLCLGLPLAASLPMLAVAQTLDAGANQAVRNIVLVHGAWANGSSWSKVIQLLEARGFHVVAAQMPLTSLKDDDDAVERSIERITQTNPGPVLLVGHSYGGVVIGDVPGNDPRVVGLVYVAAFAPDTGQSALSLLGTLSAPPPIQNYLVFDPAKPVDPSKTLVWISDEGIARAFAQDLSPIEQRGLSAVQGVTILADLLSTPTVTPAWKSKPSWFVISGHDDVITAGLEQREAQIIGAKTIELPTCHVAMLQEPERIADFISSAAESLSH